MPYFVIIKNLFMHSIFFYVNTITCVGPVNRLNKVLLHFKTQAFES